MWKWYERAEPSSVSVYDDTGRLVSQYLRGATVPVNKQDLLRLARSRNAGSSLLQSISTWPIAAMPTPTRCSRRWEAWLARRRSRRGSEARFSRASEFGYRYVVHQINMKQSSHVCGASRRDFRVRGPDIPAATRLASGSGFLGQVRRFSNDDGEGLANKACHRRR